MSGNSDEASRNQEISMFSALASGGSFEFQPSKNDTAKPPAMPTSQDKQSTFQKSILQAAIESNASGTFAMAPSSKQNGVSSNLEAAAAALAGKDNIPVEEQSTPLLLPPVPQQQRVITRPMHSERVVMPRPLFFGPWLPPRVVQELKQIQEQQGSCHANLRSTLKAFGYGLESTLNDTSTTTTTTTTAYLGTPNVFTYQPVWGNQARAERALALQKKQTKLLRLRAKQHHLETTTATAELLKSPSAISQPDANKDETGKSLAHSPLPTDDTNLFSQLARGDFTDSPITTNKEEDAFRSPVPSSDQALFSKWALADQEDDDDASLTGTETPALSSEQALFSRWALGDTSSTNLDLDSSMNATPQVSNKTMMGTFRAVTPADQAADSDEDSVVGSELKTKVGVNENLDAALQSLAKEETTEPVAPTTGSISAEESQALLSQMGQTTPGGRPLTNFELTGGSVPLFGYDDPSVPVEADLGIYETKEDQVRALERKREQEIVEKHTIPDVFGPIACPNPATGPDDNHSSNLRTVPSARKPGETVSSPVVRSMSPVPSIPKPPTAKSVGMVTSIRQASTSSDPIIPDPPPLRKAVTDGKPPRSRQGSITSGRYGTTTPYGWWNFVDEDDDNNNDAEQYVKDELLSHVLYNNDKDKHPLIKPFTDAASFLDNVVHTRLKPSPLKLRQENAPLSQLHPATSVASCLPFLSDRPPNWRYLQIDTKAIGFPPLGNELEPLFCSLAIYHVESVSVASESSSVPTPNLQKCGRVTEILHFDVVTDQEVEERCAGSLWPYHNRFRREGMEVIEAERTQGTRCGVFPLPSNLNIANLYAILVVQKVLSDKEDTVVYAKDPLDVEGKGRPVIDLERCREKAERASDRQGRFLMPFAFGVTPLLQVFGTDVPSSPTSRAVQIPLFQFTSSLGERQVIDHIMVMLYPRANHQSVGISGPAPLTNGGTAMLVMRYFGYLGLHAVVNNKSSLSRHRLVDFTGDFQVRRRAEGEPISETGVKDPAKSDRDYLVDPWMPSFVAEPTRWSGRTIVEMRFKAPEESYGSKCERAGEEQELKYSSLYAQELAALPLQVTPSVGRLTPTPSRVGRGRFGFDSDSEPYFHANFCNELLCNPRLVHNCPKGNIVTKVELREVVWDEDLNSYIATFPPGGPHLHNQRRGPSFVNEAFTSCIPSSASVHFLNEFKIKLPLLLSNPSNPGSRLVLLFSVFHVHIKPKKSWAERGAAAFSKQFGVSKPEEHKKTLAPLELLGCGFLPITTNLETCCLIDNGLHDVKLCFDAKTARVPPKEVLYDDCHDELVLTPKPDPVRTSEIRPSLRHSASSVKSDDEDSKSPGDDAVGEGSVHSRTNSAASAPFSDATSLASSAIDQMSLQIRIIVHSSLHPQNASLSEFLQCSPRSPPPLSVPTLPKTSPWRLEREGLLNYLQGEAGTPQLMNEQEQKIYSCAVDICKSSFCSHSSLTSHFVRVVDQLLITMVCGSCDLSLLWANPALVLPMRVNSFATLMQVINIVCNYLAKYGFTQLDGKSKWNSTTFGRIMALIFDEHKLFSESGVIPEEPMDTKIWASKPKKLERPQLVQRKSSGSKKRHVRSDSDTLIFSFDQLSANPADQKYTSRTLPADMIASLNRSTDAGTGPSLEETAEIWSGKGGPEGAKALGNPEDNELKSRIHDSFFSAQNDDRSSDPFGGFEGLSGRRRFMTLPSNALTTIKEDLDADEDGRDLSQTIPLSRKYSLPKESSDGFHPSSFALNAKSNSDLLDSEVVKREKKASKQFRVPKPKRAGSATGQTTDASGTERAPADLPERRERTLTSEEIEIAGTAFLDQLGKNLGLGSAPKIATGEEQQVGQANHRKTRSRCSIDWSLPQDDMLFERSQSLELDSSSSSSKSSRQGSESAIAASQSLEVSSLKPESQNAKKLSSYLDRILLLSDTENINGRWFPYVYEVMIFQWVAILTEQHRTVERKIGENSSKASGEYLSSWTDGEAALRDAATRARGFAVSCAPVLFEIIKKSLGARLHDLIRKADGNSETAPDTPPVVRLDIVLLDNLEMLISMLTDACIDSRNFDSREFQQISFDVNDSIVRFLRDMFAFLDPECVHRLILVYFSRFVVKDGKIWQDRDSKIGLRCSWEICKLRLNAVTAFVRFADFVHVNSPQMLNWGSWPMTSPGETAQSFFDRILVTFLSLGLPSFSNDGPKSNSAIKIPHLQPHWLAELLVDICLSGTEHAEQKIQHRASSLLHELFWSHSMEGRVSGSSTVIGSMYVSFLLKILGHVSYLSSLGAKTQLRKDLMPCVVFVLQCAPTGLIRSFWRKLCLAARGKGSNPKFGPTPGFAVETSPVQVDASHELHIFDMFSLLNVALATFEYEGCEENLDSEDLAEEDNIVAVWTREYQPMLKKQSHDAFYRRTPMSRRYSTDKEKSTEVAVPTYSSTSGRRWHSHDGSLVIINSSRYIVREFLTLLKPEIDGQSNSAPNSGRFAGFEMKGDIGGFSYADQLVFVRAASSVYLHSLCLHTSDIVIVKTLTASVELVKIFHIEVFLEAVGKTLQHWMRLVVLHCGARRTDVRVQALEFLALILRMTWDSYGSFLRIRLPLLSVQTEVMERIVATAAARYYREQRKIPNTSFQYLNNDSAEATLSMLWRTLDRLHKQPASKNEAFKSALERLAQKMKTLYKAYIAAHALSIHRRVRAPHSPTSYPNDSNQPETFEQAALNQSRRISVHRIINNSAGYCKQFMGVHRPNPQRDSVLHNEAVEDAFNDAADVFSATELPSHRVAWLQKLAEFHSDRQKHAEEATCHFQIQVTLRQASRLHEMIWSSSPFLPWTDGGVYIEGEGVAAEPEDYFDTDDEMDDFLEDQGLIQSEYGRQVEKSNAFRRIFYRVANSVRMRTGDWELSGNKHLFYGVTLASEYGDSQPWMPLREMEERMIEAAEAAGDLYLKAGISQNSRIALGLVTSYYAISYNFPKLYHTYKRLAGVVYSQVPVVDMNDHSLDFSHNIGRFYRVWFHGGAPDELIGAEFVYRARSTVTLEEFGKELSERIRSVLPDKTPIDLVLEDGRPEEPMSWRPNQRRALGPSPLEPVKIKVTPLRPLLTDAVQIRGTPEWFNTFSDSPLTGKGGRGPRYGRTSPQESPRSFVSHHGHGHQRSYSSSVFGSSGSRGVRGSAEYRLTDISFANRIDPSIETDNLVKVDKFSFLQPIRRDRNRSSRDWIKGSGDFTEKNIRVTQLQVERSFPACVARQSVVNRSVFKQSPLEAAVDAVCTWCSVLFRTAVATNGLVALRQAKEPGIGNAAAKVVADCIHSSRVKDMGVTFLKNQRSVAEETFGEYASIGFDNSRMSDEEIRRLQVKLARGIVNFIELLHLLISRNRDLLLAVVEARKEYANAQAAAQNGSGGSKGPGSFKDNVSIGSPEGRKGLFAASMPAPTGIHARTASNSTQSSQLRAISHPAHAHTSSGPIAVTAAKPRSQLSASSVPLTHESPQIRPRKFGTAGSVSVGSLNDKTDSAIAVQSELQRSFVSMTKVLFPNLTTILGDEAPRWLRQCSQDNYFSTYTYRQTDIRMADEICFYSPDDFRSDSESATEEDESFTVSASIVSSAHPALTGFLPEYGSFDGGSVTSRGSIQRVLLQPIKGPDDVGGVLGRTKSADGLSFQQEV